MATWLSGHTRVAFLFLAFVGCGEAFSGGGNEAGEAGASAQGGSSGGMGKGAGGSGASSGEGGVAGSGGEGGAPAADGGAANSGNPGSGGVAGTGLAGVAGLAGTGGIVVEPVVPREGLLLWLRADAGVTLTEDHHVLSWADQSGNDWLVEQTGGDEQPTLVTSGEGGMPRVEFDGDDDFMRIPVGFDDFSDGLSAFVVTNARTLDACWALIELSNGSEVDDIYLGHYSQSVHYEVLDTWVTEGAYPVGEDLVLAVIHDKNDLVETRTNGNHAGDLMISLPSKVERAENFLGRSQYTNCGVLEGSISEVLLYNRAVSSEELIAIEDYLAARWGCCRD